MSATWQMDIIIYDDHDHEDDFPKRQATYLVHSHEDVLWTDDIEEALSFLRADLTHLAERATSRA